MIYIIFLLAFLIRWYKLPEYLFFGYEQARDALVIKGIYTLCSLTLIGPKTDIDGIFHGPLYYYLMSPVYAIGGGNPVFASLILVFLTSLIPVILFFLYKNVFGSKIWAFFGATISVFSFELITYSRWLHHYAFGLFFVVLSMYFLWDFIKQKQDKFFILSVIFAGLASQFEIILPLQFIVVYSSLLIFKVIRIPSLKAIFLAGTANLIIFAPLIIFNFRHQNIIGNAIFNLLQKGSHGFDFRNYYWQIESVFQRSLVNIDGTQIVVFLMLVTGLWLCWKNLKLRLALWFFLAWSLMSLGILPFGVSLPQLFLGTGVGLIGLLLLAMKSSKLITAAMLILMLCGWKNNLQNIQNNHNFFFVTIQDDLNLADQKKLLKYIHDDADGQPYQLVAFTIPYLHPEAWQYLQKLYYSNDKSENAKIKYVIIESQVAFYHKDQWIADLGPTQLVWEKYFGKIRLQKRI